MWERKGEKVLRGATNINPLVPCSALLPHLGTAVQWIPRAQTGFCFAQYCDISVTPSFSWAPH